MTSCSRGWGSQDRKTFANPIWMKEQIDTPTHWHWISFRERKVSPTALSMSTSIHILIGWVDVEEIDRIMTRHDDRWNIEKTKSHQNEQSFMLEITYLVSWLLRFQINFLKRKNAQILNFLLAADFTSISRLTTPVERLLGFFFLWIGFSCVGVPLELPSFSPTNKHCQ